MIRVDSVTVKYDNENEAVSNISFSIMEKEAVGLIGANGAGKSTIMKAMLGLVPFAGSIHVENIEVVRDNIRKIRRKLGYVLQNSDNQMFMPTVIEDMMFGPLNYGHSHEEAEKIADQALIQMGIENLKYRHNHKLSGGEKRMAAIACVLAMRPRILLMDEPTSALDPYNRKIVIDRINEIDRTKIISSHDLDMIMDTCSRVILLSEGKIVADGNAQEILTDKALLEKNHLELPLRITRG